MLAGKRKTVALPGADSERYSAGKLHPTRFSHYYRAPRSNERQGGYVDGICILDKNLVGGTGAGHECGVGSLAGKQCGSPCDRVADESSRERGWIIVRLDRTKNERCVLL